MEESAPILVITCAAIAREVNEIKKLGQWLQMDLQAITADLHARPEKIPAAVAEKIDQAAGRYEHIFVAYGDCGTAGELDRAVLSRLRLDLLVQVDGVLLQAGHVWIAVERVHPTG